MNRRNLQALKHFLISAAIFAAALFLFTAAAGWNFTYIGIVEAAAVALLAYFALKNRRRISNLTDANLNYTQQINEYEELKTRQSEIEDALRKSENLFRTLATFSPVGIFQTDAEGDCLFVNDRWIEMTGISREDAMGKGWSASLHADDRELVFNKWYECAAEKSEFAMDYRFVPRAGETVWVSGRAVALEDAGGKTLGYIGTITDITESKVTEDALRESEERFRTFMNASPTVAYMKDEKGHYHFINQMMTDLYHVTTESLRGKTDFEWLPADVAEQVTTNDAKVLASRETIRTIEIVPYPNGETRHWLTLKFPFINNEGKNFVGGVAVDVTDRQLAEEKLEVSLAEKETLLKEVHHRVKNNLQIISSLLSMQIRRLTDVESIEKLNATRQRVQAMALIHEKLYQSQSFAQIDLAAYLSELTEIIFRTYEGKTLAVNLKTECENVNVSVEKALPCALIVNELISNSLKYAFSHQRGGNVWLRLSQTGSRVCLEVGDDGSGLPPGFEPEATRSLGLKLVSSLVQQLDAEMKIVNDGGTIFKLTFDT